jgi:hypothetical protein
VERRGRLGGSDGEIVLGAISVVAEARWLVQLTAVFALLAALLTLNGFFLLVELPLESGRPVSVVGRDRLECSLLGGWPISAARRFSHHQPWIAQRDSASCFCRKSTGEFFLQVE